MATSKETIAHLLEQLEPLETRARAMFGEYGMYCDGKFVALVCDDTFYLKPSAVADSLGIPLVPAPPYPGAKDYFLVGEAIVEDEARFRRAVQATADSLPAPKPRTPRRR